MDRKDAEDLTNDMLIADALLRVRSMESLLISKGLFTQEELNQTMDVIARTIAKNILEQSKVPGALDDLIDTLQGKSSTPTVSDTTVERRKIKN